jgi:hypothetical protein
MKPEREIAAANATLAWAHDVMGLDWNGVANAIGADQRTILRWRQGTTLPSREHRRRIADMRELRVLLELVLPDASNRSEWLRNPVPAFHGRSPITLIQDGRLDDVLGVLAGVYTGAFA